MSGYNATLKSGKEIYIPTWKPSIALENLSKAGKYIGGNNLLNIADLNTEIVLLAIINAENPSMTAGLIKHFVCTVRMDGNKITEDKYEQIFSDDLALILELFAHVVKGVYGDFFAQGLVGEASQ